MLSRLLPVGPDGLRRSDRVPACACRCATDQLPIAFASLVGRSAAAGSKPSLRRSGASGRSPWPASVGRAGFLQAHRRGAAGSPANLQQPSSVWASLAQLTGCPGRTGLSLRVSVDGSPRRRLPT